MLNKHFIVSIWLRRASFHHILYRFFTYLAHVGLMLGNPHGAHITCLLSPHAHFAFSYPLWDPYGQPAWASNMGPMLLKSYGSQTIFPVQAHAHLVPMQPLCDPYVHVGWVTGLVLSLGSLVTSVWWVIKRLMLYESRGCTN